MPLQRIAADQRHHHICVNPAPIPIVRNSSGMEMPNGADGGNHMYNGNGTTASNSSTSFNHKRKRKLLDDCNYMEINQPSKRANLRSECSQPPKSHQQPLLADADATAAASQASASAAAAPVQQHPPNSSSHMLSQPLPQQHHPPHHHSAVAASVFPPPINAVASAMIGTVPDTGCYAANGATNNATHTITTCPTAGAAAKRASRKPKSPATKAREKARAKERAVERERERESYRIGDDAVPLLDGAPPTPIALSTTDAPAAESSAAAGTPNVCNTNASTSAASTAITHSSSPAAAAITSTTGIDGTVTTSTFGVEATKPADLRLCPLPALAWAEAADVWRLMCRKDEKALLERDPAMLDRHPGIQARMRAILLDWLMEVCEVYKLHRETYYLAVDYLDRYLTANIRLAKTRLQLIGITCLFTAAKVEEIYPPKIAEFAYVTDGACTEDDIVKQEMMLMLGLNWSINPVTIVGWLSVYMQLNCSNRTPASLSKLVNSDSVAPATVAPNIGAAFVYPQFSALEFVLAARILDLCTLDVEMAHFQYSVVAAAVLVLTINRTTALRVSGLDWHMVKPCVKWMEPFYEVVVADSAQLFLGEQDEQIQQSYGLRHICADITTDDSHIIQTHTTSVALFEEALKKREAKIALAIRTNKKIAAAEAKKKQQSTPAGQTTSSSAIANGVSSPGGPLTPPDSNRKFNEAPSRLTAAIVGNGGGAGDGVGPVSVAAAVVGVVGVGASGVAAEPDLQMQPSVY